MSPASAARPDSMLEFSRFSREDEIPNEFEDLRDGP
jgi:hypothetical protein